MDEVETWYEAKSGTFWEQVLKDHKRMESFKGKMGEAVKIARENNARFEIISEKAIPESIKQWLTKKGIPFREEARATPPPQTGPMKYSAD
ncbi:hypothetical protein Nocox_39675 [Nonomuraea coxensis DSM 45129]|uniref:Tox-REase-5 domain-containing protein n=1 Tax=Nonomuraea coxensis DSM 45129 TaxID=1122611 RepID=A0ABX8UGC3_9ACTN|nr:hypothetical protein [Nonomuraea coxensis]QYC45478.1 hypothetical protein Nocox_39675 [Nonomuraea coxensis DSM 45129]